MKTFKLGGIHPPGNKVTAHMPIKVWEPKSNELRILLNQCIGAPSQPLKKAGDKVAAGELIASPGGFVSAAIHSPVNGTVKKIDQVRDGQGLWKKAIIIEADNFEMPVANPRTPEEVEALTAKEIVDIIAENGIVGLGGATFPTHVKLTPPKDATPEIVLINGAECEPVLTCDDRLMQAKSREIVLGTQLIMRAVNVNKAIIGIEENKPDAIAAMQEAARDAEGVSVVVLKKKYPQGGEKQLIQALTGREVAPGALPVSVGAVVDNVATAYAIYDAVYNRLPLTHRVATVSGDTPHQGNWLIPMGIAASEFIEGEQLQGEYKFIAGGPMMGKALSNPASPTTKGFSGLIVKTDNVERKPAKPCIRCARCVDACPMGLEPYLMMLLTQHLEFETLRDRNAMSCIECGSCSYVCPSDRPLLDFIRLGKSKIKNLK